MESHAGAFGPLTTETTRAPLPPQEPEARTRRRLPASVPSSGAGPGVRPLTGQASLGKHPCAGAGVGRDLHVSACDRAPATPFHFQKPRPLLPQERAPRFGRPPAPPQPPGQGASTWAARRGWACGLTSAGHVVHAGRAQQLHWLVSARKSIWRTRKHLASEPARISIKILYTPQATETPVSSSLLKENGFIFYSPRSKVKDRPPLCKITRGVPIAHVAEATSWPGGLWPSCRGCCGFPPFSDHLTRPPPPRPCCRSDRSIKATRWEEPLVLPQVQTNGLGPPRHSPRGPAGTAVRVRVRLPAGPSRKLGHVLKGNTGPGT